MWTGAPIKTPLPGARPHPHSRCAALFGLIGLPALMALVALVALAPLAAAALGHPVIATVTAPAPEAVGTEAVGPAVPVVSDILVVYQSGPAVGTRTIQADLEDGPNRLIIGALPALVDAAGAELVGLEGHIAVRSKFYDSSAQCLVFTVEPKTPGPATIRLTYTFPGLGWSASYTVMLNGHRDEAAVTGWYCVRNQTGSSLSPQSMTLVAGHSNMLAGKAEVRGAAALGATAAVVACSDEMPHGADVYFQFVQADKAPARMVYLVDRIGVTQPDLSILRKEDTSVLVALEITVSGPDLDPPLPGGRATVFARSENGAAYLLGQDEVAMVGTAGPVVVRLGRAPHLRVEKARTDQKKTGTSSWEEAYQIRITNFGSEQADVVILEEFPGEWGILQSTPIAATRSPQGLARFSLAVPAGARTEVLYRVRYTLQM